MKNNSNKELGCWDDDSFEPVELDWTMNVLVDTSQTKEADSAYDDWLRCQTKDHTKVVEKVKYKASKCNNNTWAMPENAEHGHMEVLKWAIENNCPVVDTLTCAHLANGGQLEMLKWARGNDWLWDKHTCKWDADGGHLDILKWALENGCPCPWDADEEHEIWDSLGAQED